MLDHENEVLESIFFKLVVVDAMAMGPGSLLLTWSLGTRREAVNHRPAPSVGASEPKEPQPTFSLVNVVYSRGSGARGNHRTNGDHILYTAARDEDYVLRRDWNISSFAAQEVFQWHR